MNRLKIFAAGILMALSAVPRVAMAALCCLASVAIAAGFDTLTNGTNVGQGSMIVGTGSAIRPSGTGAVRANELTDGTVANAGVNSSAAIVATKLAYEGSTNIAASNVEVALDYIGNNFARVADILLTSQVVRADMDSTVASDSDITMASGSTQTFSTGSTLTLSGTVTAAPADGSTLNYAAVDQSSTTEGVTLPRHATNCEVNSTVAGKACYKTGGVLFVGNGLWADPVWGRPGALWRARYQGTQHTNTSPDFNLNGAGGTPTFALQTATASNPQGVMRMTTNTGATDTVYISGPPSGNAAFFPAQGQAVFDARVSLSALPDATFDFRCGIGNLPTAMGSSTVGAFFLVDNTTANFRVAHGNGTLTTTNSTTAVASGTMYRLTIVMNPAWTTATFYVNGALATGFTNPATITAPASALSFGCQLRKISGAGQPYMDVDYEEFSYVLTTPN